MVNLCHRRETAKRAKHQPPNQQARPEQEFPLLILAKQYPRYISNIGLSYEERMFKYGRPGTRNKHFNNEYLKELYSL